jgi:heme exporter protein B
VKALILRDLRLTLRQGADSVSSLLFFIICAALFAFGVGPDASSLTPIAPAIIWVGALLAALLPLERLLGADFEDGTLDLLLLSGLPAHGVAVAKAIVHWLTTGLPLLLIAAPVAVMLRLPPASLPLLLGSLALGTVIFSLIGTLAAALTLGARRGAVLMPLITLPLMIPALIFGTAASNNITPLPAFELLGAITLLALPLCPLAAGLALRAAAE